MITVGTEIYDRDLKVILIDDRKRLKNKIKINFFSTVLIRVLKINQLAFCLSGCYGDTISVIITSGRL